MASHSFQDPINPDLRERLEAYKLQKAKPARFNWGIVIILVILAVAGGAVWLTIEAIGARLNFS